jgi:hypothetical protein
MNAAQAGFSARGGQGVAILVADRPLERIGRAGQPAAREAERLDQRDGRAVARIDLGVDPPDRVAREQMRDDGADRFRRHAAPPLIGKHQAGDRRRSPRRPHRRLHVAGKGRAVRCADRPVQPDLGAVRRCLARERLDARGRAGRE